MTWHKRFKDASRVFALVFIGTGFFDISASASAGYICFICALTAYILEDLN